MSALSSFFSNLVDLEALEATIVSDNAAGHEPPRRRPRRGRRHNVNKAKTVSRWQSWPSEEQEETNVSDDDVQSTTEEKASRSPTLRRPKRSMSSEKEMQKLNETRFSSCARPSTADKMEKSQRVMALRQPQRQVTPDINYDIERAMAMKKEQALRKPMRQLTPPEPVGQKRWAQAA